MKKSGTTTQTVESKNKIILSLIKSTLSGTCIIFTVFTLIVLTPQLFGQNDLIQPLRFFMIFPFSLCFAVANLIFKIKSLKTFIKLILHFSLVALSFYLCLCSSVKELNPLVLILLLGVIYVMIAIPVVIILRRRSKKLEKKPEYTPMFKGSSKSSK